MTRFAYRSLHLSQWMVVGLAWCDAAAKYSLACVPFPYPSLRKLAHRVSFQAFEKLASLRVFVAASSAAAGTGKEFIKYRCDVDRAEVKGAVDKTGQLNLKKWLNKAQ